MRLGIDHEDARGSERVGAGSRRQNGLSGDPRCKSNSKVTRGATRTPTLTLPAIEHRPHSQISQTNYSWLDKSHLNYWTYSRFHFAGVGCSLARHGGYHMHHAVAVVTQIAQERGQRDRRLRRGIVQQEYAFFVSLKPAIIFSAVVPASS